MARPSSRPRARSASPTAPPSSRSSRRFRRTAHSRCDSRSRRASRKGCPFSFAESSMSVARIERAVISGAGGFVGRSLASLVEATTTQVHLGEPDWMEQVRAADYAGAIVFHLAARVHRAGSDTDASYWHDTVGETRASSRPAAAVRARRFVLLRSPKVNGSGPSHRAYP